MNMRNSKMLTERYVHHPLKGDIQAALAAAEHFGDRSLAIQNNRNLSPEGKATELKAQIRAALRDIRDSSGSIADMQKGLYPEEATPV